MDGTDPDIAQIRWARVEHSRDDILRLPDAAQKACVKEIMLGAEETDCLWGVTSTNPFEDLIPKKPKATGLAAPAH